MNDVRFRLYLITDRHLAPDGDLPRWIGRALSGLPEGAVAVQLREKDLPVRDLMVLAHEVLAVTRRLGAPLLINDRVDVAVAVGADGVHLPSSGMTPNAARSLLGWSKLLGASTHTLAEARAAQAGGCDLVTYGPVFPTPSKARLGKPVGLGALQETAAGLPGFPVFALGGISVDNAASCRQAGAAGVAAIRAAWATTDSADTTRRLLAALDDRT
jgi:thiamine-phosphate pyrophosphorylase